MLHSFNKNDKNAKQQTMETIKKMEEELKKQQEDELKTFDTNSAAEKKKEEEEVEEEEKDAKKNNNNNSKAPAKQGGKTQKKKAKRAAKEAAQRAAIEEEKRNTVSERQVELTQLQMTLKPLNLKIVEIPADGDCLYNSVSHQLKLLRSPEQLEELSATIEKLREQVAEFMQHHSEEFLPFYDTEEEEEEEEDLSSAFSRYCRTVATTRAWGGQLELKALAQLFKQHIVVHNATGPPIEMGEEFKASSTSPTPLHLTYHKHYYALGAHYNSAVHESLLPSEEEEEAQKKEGDKDNKEQQTTPAEGTVKQR
jgi:OTU domain-containing protein 6